MNKSIIQIFLLLICWVTAHAQTDTLTINGDTIFTTVDVAPEFKGGNKAFMSYISKNLRYPASARRSGIEGQVYVSFIITKIGEVTEAKVLKGISPDCDEAALAMFYQSPAWIPGYQHGKPVYTRMVVPIKFKLASGKGSDKDGDDFASLHHESIEWSEGSIMVNDGTELKGLLRYNDNNGILSYENGNASKSFTARNVAGFEYLDAVNQKQRVFYAFPYEDSQYNVKRPLFFEVVKEFEKFVVLSKVDPVDIEQKSNYMSGGFNPATGFYTPDSNLGSTIKILQTETIYIMDTKGNIQPYIKIVEKETDGILYDVSKTKNIMLDEDLLEKYVGSEMYKKLTSYAKENNLRLKRKSDFIKILNYYSELIK